MTQNEFTESALNPEDDFGAEFEPGEEEITPGEEPSEDLDEEKEKDDDADDPDFAIEN